MLARVESPARPRLQRIGHVDESVAGLRLDKSPPLGLGQLQLDAPLVAEEKGQAARVGVLVIRHIGQLVLAWPIEQHETTIAGLVGSMDVFEPIVLV